ncbi:MAG: helix-turn-helix domain-containing protein [Caulobacteraceae bacterium]
MMAKFETMKIGELKTLMAAPGRSQTGLAKALGIDPTGVSKLLSGKRSLKASEIPKIQQYLADTEPFTGGQTEPRATVMPELANLGLAGLPDHMLSLAQKGNDSELIIVYTNAIEDEYRSFIHRKGLAELEPYIGERLDILARHATDAGVPPGISDFSKMLAFREIFTKATRQLDLRDHEVHRLAVDFIGAGPAFDKALAEVSNEFAAVLLRTFFVLRACIELIFWKSDASAAGVAQLQQLFKLNMATLG